MKMKEYRVRIFHWLSTPSTQIN